MDLSIQQLMDSIPLSFRHSNSIIDSPDTNTVRLFELMQNYNNEFNINLRTDYKKVEPSLKSHGIEFTVPIQQYSCNKIIINIFDLVKIFTENYVDVIETFFENADKYDYILERLFIFACRYSIIEIIQYFLLKDINILVCIRLVAYDFYPISIIMERTDDNVEILELVYHYVAKKYQIDSKEFNLYLTLLNNSLDATIVCGNTKCFKYILKLLEEHNRSPIYDKKLIFLARELEILDYLVQHGKITGYDIIIGLRSLPQPCPQVVEILSAIKDYYSSGQLKLTKDYIIEIEHLLGFKLMAYDKPLV
jgi:hypothetical protein